MAKATASQVREFLDGILQCVVDRDHFQRHIESGRVFELLRADPDLIDEVAFRAALDPKLGEDRDFSVEVDFSIPLLKQISRGRYAVVSDLVNARNYPPSDSGLTGVRPCRMRLFRLRRKMTEKKVLADLARKGARPARLEELLAFGVKYPDFQRRFPVVGLGSKWFDGDGRASVPVLGMAFAGRSLDLCWAAPKDCWHPFFRMLAICE